MTDRIYVQIMTLCAHSYMLFTRLYTDTMSRAYVWSTITNNHEKSSEVLLKATSNHRCYQCAKRMDWLSGLYTISTTLGGLYSAKEMMDERTISHTLPCHTSWSPATPWTILATKTLNYYKISPATNNPCNYKKCWWLNK